jgi:hypothetical protein
MPAPCNNNDDKRRNRSHLKSQSGIYHSIL